MPTPALVVLDANWDSTHQLFTALGARIPALLLKTNTFSQAWHAGLPLREFLRPQALENGHYLRRYAFPPGWFSWLAPAAMRALTLSIRRTLARLHYAPQVLTLSYPQYWRVLKHLAPRKSVYYCVDDYRCYWPWRAARTEALENQMVLQADLVVCASRFMKDELSRRAPQAARKIVHISNGVRESFVAEAPLERPGPLPSELAHLPRPVIGYLGGIGGRMNWKIVRAVLQHFPAATFLLIGPPPPGGEDAAALAALRACANFHYAGPRPQARIMEYIRAFDICVIPEPYQPFSLATCPQKLFNYLASSRPIVSTRIPEQVWWSPAVRVAQAEEEFCAALAELLACGCQDGLAQQRLEIARQHTWPRLAERLWGHLGEFGLLEGMDVCLRNGVVFHQS